MTATSKQEAAMFLLNSETIVRSVKERQFLEIEPFDQKGLGPSYYYFGLGRYYCKWNAQKNDWVTGDLTTPGGETLLLQGNEYVLVQSYERFRCSKQCLALFGQSSRLARMGLSLRSSPFIDPNFPRSDQTGYLEFGLKNELPRTVRLRYKERIGKVSFFNIADTYPIGDVTGTISEDDFNRRTNADAVRPLYDDDPDHKGEWRGVVEHGKRRDR
jgi:deoxycytidine triphosphate deaminase